MKIESEDIDLESLLSSNYFSIPRFQRPYSWTDENIQDLWDDVVSSENDDYFIGSMVAYRREKQSFAIVDGQQRLTTLTVFLCILRDELKRLDEEDLAAGIHQLVERKDRNNRNQYVLQTQTSFPFLQEKILRFGDPELSDIVEMAEEQSLRAAYQSLSKKINSMLEAVDQDASILENEKRGIKVDRVVKIRDAVLNLKLIFVKLENEEDAYLIFETLNTRGKDLALSDLVKTHFTKNLRITNTIDAVKEKWSSLMETIHNSSADITPDSFIYHFWASRNEAVPQKKLYPIIKKQIGENNARSHLDSLVQDSVYYRAIHEPGYFWGVNEARVARSLAAIQLFRLVQPTPALLSLVRSYKNGTIKLGKLVEALEAIEKFHFAFTAVTSSRSSGGISGMYSAFARRLFECDDSQAAALEIKSLVGKLRERVPPYDEFLASFRQINFTNSNSKQKNLVRYILRKFSIESNLKFSADFDELTIEHFSPQANIGSNGWDSGVIGQLGNLFFLEPSMNEMLGSKSFDKKMELIKSKNLNVPLDVLSAEKWDPADVLAHTDRLAHVAYTKIWKV
ncbi:DUF262 domain-containing protein [Arthrobacter russicus]|uniref:DUF262 domain-containing protein n=1 Tax=Arthrobacter russicus TaxID=172040 RepID=A0ABU1JD23_9MICC|nr:DUF262 domain-containing HNH endonuclease family protein [Arthrobacter russicus]MDR6270044.1 hypothetical protein [Arthrobacter russicus]